MVHCMLHGRNTETLPPRCRIHPRWGSINGSPLKEHFDGENHLPFVSLEVFEFHSKRVILVVGEHVNVLVTEPEFSSRIAEAVFVVDPISVEIFPRLAEVVPPLYHLCT